MTEGPIIYKLVHRFAEQINGLVSIYRNLRHERVNIHLVHTHIETG